MLPIFQSWESTVIKGGQKKNEKEESGAEETFLLGVLSSIFFSSYDAPLRLRKKWASSLQLLL